MLSNIIPNRAGSLWAPSTFRASDEEVPSFKYIIDDYGVAAIQATAGLALMGWKFAPTVYYKPQRHD